MAKDDRPLTISEFVLYQSEDGLAWVQIRVYEGTVWLTQKQLAELYQWSVPSISEHIRHIYSDGELAPEALGKKRPTKRRKGGG